MWIEKSEKEFYNDSDAKGLRLFFEDGISEEEKKWCKQFCRWLTKKYWFPIRCKIFFSSMVKFKSQKRGFCDGIFYSNEEYKTFHYPSIYIATKFVQEDDKYYRIFALAHELTHYFQWYFYEYETKSKRSLEIMATRWANYIVDEYLYENNL